MDSFIDKFKQTSFYQKMFNIDEEILLIYIGGSRCFNTMHEFSDYDITIITSGGEFRDIHEQYYLRYEDKKVHWYYCPIQWLFKANYNCVYYYIGSLTLKNITDELILYKNPKYDSVLDKLYKVSENLLSLTSYRLFNFKDTYIREILDSGDNIEEPPSKVLYHLCLASYFLFKEPLETDFLRALSLSSRNIPLPAKYKKKVIERLTLCTDYIKQNPIDIDNELNNLYKQFKNEMNG